EPSLNRTRMVSLCASSKLCLAVTRYPIPSESCAGTWTRNAVPPGPLPGVERNTTMSRNCVPIHDIENSLPWGYSAFGGRCSDQYSRVTTEGRRGAWHSHYTVTRPFQTITSLPGPLASPATPRTTPHNPATHPSAPSAHPPTPAPDCSSCYVRPAHP